MASKRHSRRRTIPYDLGNPTNWTAAQLRKEISKLGVNLTNSIPKTALIQIYTQLYTASSSTVSQGQSNVSEKKQMKMMEIYWIDFKVKMCKWISHKTQVFLLI